MKTLNDYEYYKNNRDVLYNGDCLDVLKLLDDNSVDLVVTDPPYNLGDKNMLYKFELSGSGNYSPGREQKRTGFMNKEWDVLPSVDIWKECLRVIKPGAFAFILMTPRQDSLWRCLRDLESAGFVIDFTSLYWTYASGFPKAQNISKAIDKRAGAERDVVGVDKKAPHKNGTTYGWASCNDSGECIRDKPATPEAKRFDGAYGGFQPKPAVEIILVAMKPHDKAYRLDVYEKLNHQYNYFVNTNIEFTDTTNDKSRRAALIKQLKKYSKKYDFEFKEGDVLQIRIALNPDKKDNVRVRRGERWYVLNETGFKNTVITNYVTQAIMNGKGVTWMGDCRIPYKNDDDKDSRVGKDFDYSSAEEKSIFGVGNQIGGVGDGRFPANLLVSDDVLNDGVVTKSSDSVRHNKSTWGGVRT